MDGRIKYNPIIQREMLLVTTAKLAIAKLFNIDLFSLFNITRSYKIKKNYFQQKRLNKFNFNRRIRFFTFD